MQLHCNCGIVFAHYPTRFSLRGCCCVSSSVGVIARLQKISSWSNAKCQIRKYINAKYKLQTTKYKHNIMQNPTKHAAEVVDEMRKMMPRDESRVGSKETRPALASGQTEQSGAERTSIHCHLMQLWCLAVFCLKRTLSFIYEILLRGSSSCSTRSQAANATGATRHEIFIMVC